MAEDVRPPSPPVGTCIGVTWCLCPRHRAARKHLGGLAGMLFGPPVQLPADPPMVPPGRTVVPKAQAELSENGGLR